MLFSAAFGLASVAVALPAQAAVEKLEFSGYFLGGSAAPFPLSPATITGTLTYDTTNSGVVTPYNYTFVNADSTQGSSAWYNNSITSFSFKSIGAAAGSAINGSYSGPGAGSFVVYNNNGGLDALAPGVAASDGLTGLAPAGYSLVSAGLYYYSTSRYLGSNALPSITNGGEPVHGFPLCRAGQWRPVRCDLRQCSRRRCDHLRDGDDFWRARTVDLGAHAAGICGPRVCGTAIVAEAFSASCLAGQSTRLLWAGARAGPVNWRYVGPPRKFTLFGRHQNVEAAPWGGL